MVHGLRLTFHPANEASDSEEEMEGKKAEILGRIEFYLIAKRVSLKRLGQRENEFI